MAQLVQTKRTQNSNMMLYIICVLLQNLRDKIETKKNVMFLFFAKYIIEDVEHEYITDRQTLYFLKSMLHQIGEVTYYLYRRQIL